MLAVAVLSSLSQVLKDPRAPWHWPAPFHRAHHSPEWWVVWAAMAVRAVLWGWDTEGRPIRWQPCAPACAQRTHHADEFHLCLPVILSVFPL